MAQIENGDIETHIQVSNKTYRYLEEVEGVKGGLSKQFPTIANPAPLGLGGFALTTFVLSMFNAGVIVNIYTPQGIVMGLALFYGGMIQLLAGMWEFKTGNTLGAVAFSSYGGFWMSLAALNIKAFGFLDGYGTDTNATADINNGLGIYLLAWAIFSFLMVLASHRTTFCLCFLFFVVFLTFMCLSIGKFTDDIHSIKWQRAGGSFGIIAALLAWYCAIAAMLTKRNSFFTLPLGELDPIYKGWGWINAENEKQT